MTPETKKTLLLAGAALVAGGVSVPVLSWIGGKTFSLAGAVGPYIAPVGAVGAGVLLATIGKSHPTALGAGVALAAVGGYGLVTTYQAEAASKLPTTTTAGNLQEFAGAGGGGRAGGGGGHGGAHAGPRGGGGARGGHPPAAPRAPVPVRPAGAPGAPGAPRRAGPPQAPFGGGGGGMGGGGGGGGGPHGPHGPHHHHHHPHPGPGWWGGWGGWWGDGWGYPYPVYVDDCTYYLDDAGNEWCIHADGTTVMTRTAAQLAATVPPTPQQATGSGHLPPSFARRLTGQHRTWASIQGG